MERIYFFTIILPVYNAIKYIEKTLESIILQSCNNFELIIIDDGSTDGSGEICKRYSTEHDNIIYIKQDNKGICNARNTALSYALGTYVVFCDHDDILHPKSIKILYNKLKNGLFDALKYSYKNEVIYKNKVQKEYTIKCDNLELSSIDLKKDYKAFNQFVYTVWNGAYKLETIKKARISFDESVRYGMEDVIYNLNYIVRNQKIIMIQDVLYTHYIRYGQSTSRKYDINKIFSIYKSIELERDFLGNEPDASVAIQLMGKYIRSFFVAVNTGNLNITEKNTKMLINQFREKINISLSLKELILNFNLYQKDVLKVVLLKLKMYRILKNLLKGQ